MLNSISIHNFHCFVNFKLDLPRRLSLVGSNGSGKTSLWEVLAGLQDVVVRGVEAEVVFPTHSLTRWLRDDPMQRFAIELTLGTDTYRYELEILHDTRRRSPSIHYERLTAGGSALYEAIDGEVRLYGDDPRPEPRTQFPFNRKRSFLPDLEARNDNQRLITFREALADLWLLAPATRQLASTTGDEESWLDREGKNFASWWRDRLLERPELGHALPEALRPTLPGLQAVGYQSISREVRELMLTFHAQGQEYKLSMDELSDGQRALLLLYGVLLGALDGAAVVFIDEPERSLAPHEMQPWLAEMSKALDTHDGQALVISHHPVVIDYMAPSGTVRFSRPGGGAARTEEVTLETTGGRLVSEWISRPWAYEGEDVEPAT
jgi:predicted ATPase